MLKSWLNWIILAVGATLGLSLGWALWRPIPKPVEKAAPEVRQGDGSVILQRAPELASETKAPHAIPAGAKVEREVQVVVEPYASAVATSPINGSPHEGVERPPTVPSLIPMTIKCPPVTLDLSYVRMSDGTHRFIVSSPDGTIRKGMDVPMEPAEPPKKELHWTVGGLIDPLDRNTWGAFVQRHVGPLTVGVEVLKVHDRQISRSTWNTLASVGLNF